jgi:hypothetical protein
MQPTNVNIISASGIPQNNQNAISFLLSMLNRITGDKRSVARNAK